MKKIYLICAVIFVSLFLSSNSSVFADSLVPGYKAIGGFVKFQGWESVKDYIIVQPIFSEWALCNQQREFQLVNDGDLCDFGSESHCSFYYYPVAIDRKYIPDIKVVQNEWGDTYSVNCVLSASLNVYSADVIIPHMYEEAKETDPIARKDYIVTFQGVDKQTKKLLMTVSAPIIRYDENTADAKAFEASMARVNTLENVPTDGDQNKKPFTVTSKAIPSNSLNKTWGVFSCISIVAFVFILVMLISRKKIFQGRK